MSFYTEVIQHAHADCAAQIQYWSDRLKSLSTSKRTIDQLEVLADSLNRINGVATQLLPFQPNKLDVVLASEFLFDELQDRVHDAGWDNFRAHPSMPPRNGRDYYVASCAATNSLEAVLIAVATRQTAEVAA